MNISLNSYLIGSEPTNLQGHTKMLNTSGQW